MEQWKNTLLARKDWVDESVESEEAYWRVAGKTAAILATVPLLGIPLPLYRTIKDAKDAERGRQQAIARDCLRFPRDENKHPTATSQHLKNFRKALKDNFLDDSQVKNAVQYIRTQKDPLDKFYIRCGGDWKTSVRINPTKPYNLEMDLNTNRPQDIKHALQLAEYWKEHHLVPEQDWLNERQIKFNIKNLPYVATILDMTPLDITLSDKSNATAIEMPTEASAIRHLEEKMKSHRGEDLILARYHEDLDPNDVQIWRSGNSNWDPPTIKDHASGSNHLFLDCANLVRVNQAYCLVITGEGAKELHQSISQPEASKATEQKDRHSGEHPRQSGESPREQRPHGTRTRPGR